MQTWSFALRIFRSRAKRSEVRILQSFPEEREQIKPSPPHAWVRSVAMVGCVGADAFGTTLLENLKQNHVDASRVRQDGAAATGTAIIIVDSNGENSIVLSPGANSRVADTDIEPACLADARLLLVQFEIPIEAVLHSARLAKTKGIQVILNPAPAREIPDELLKMADYILPNETELCLLTGRTITDQVSLEKRGPGTALAGSYKCRCHSGRKGRFDRQQICKDICSILQGKACGYYRCGRCFHRRAGFRAATA